VAEVVVAVIVAVPVLGPNVAALLDDEANFTMEPSLEVQVAEAVTSAPPNVALNV
jgi:hypothetical protein